VLKCVGLCRCPNWISYVAVVLTILTGNSTFRNLWLSCQSTYSQPQITQVEYVKTNSFHFNAHFFQVNLGQPVLLKLRITEVVVKTGAISRAKILSNRHHQQTNIHLFTGQMPFLSPNQQWRAQKEYTNIQNIQTVCTIYLCFNGRFPCEPGLVTRMSPFCILFRVAPDLIFFKSRRSRICNFKSGQGRGRIWPTTRLLLL